MDDLKFGFQDNKGDWKPHNKISYAPLLNWPLNLKVIFKWIFGFPGFLFPWNIFYLFLAIGIWSYATPSLNTMSALNLEWVLLVWMRNLALAITIYGSWHLWLYFLKKQGTRFKYNKQWINNNSKNFLFKNQTYDNILWSLESGVSVWTLYEVLFLWSYANGTINILTFKEHPLIFILLFFLIPLIHELGFYFIHRILHIHTLYKIAHKIHHRNINPGPWSGLSMHPIEHILYFGIVGFLLLFPTHPVLMINLISRLGISPAEGHTGFDRVVVGKDKSINTSFYAHYLHHKYFEVNYADGIFPLDKLFGSFHDCTRNGDEIMKKRFRRKKI